jgi:hypothetical protein
MSRRAAGLILSSIGGLVLACVIGLAIELAPALPFVHEQARQRWEQRGLRHYELDVSWASGLSFGYARVEMLDNRIVAGVDLETGRPLDRNRMIAASAFASIDNLFGMIAAQIRPSTTWRRQLARYHPLLADRLDPCAALMPRISYDSELGYPTSISYRGSPCSDGGDLFLKIAHFRPLP